MKQVPLRLFQLRPSDYLKELPITLTRYGRTILIVANYKKHISLFEPKKDDIVITQTEPEKPPSAVTKEVSDKIVERIEESEIEALGIGPSQKVTLKCQECHLEKTVYRVGYDDSDGTHLWDKWLCLPCLKSIHEKVNKYGGKLKGK